MYKKPSGKFTYQEGFLYVCIRRTPCMSKSLGDLRMLLGELYSTNAIQREAAQRIRTAFLVYCSATTAKNNKFSVPLFIKLWVCPFGQ